MIRGYISRQFPADRMPLVVITLTLLIFGVATWLVTGHVRAQIRDRIIDRDGEILHAVAMMLQMEQTDGQPDVLVDDPVNQFNVLLKTSRMKWVVGTRLYDANGNFVASFPSYVQAAALTAREQEAVKNLRTVSRFEPASSLDEVFLNPASGSGKTKEPVPLLIVAIPLHNKGSGRLAGAAQFVIDGHSIAQEFAALDWNLWWQAMITFLVGSVLMFASLNWAFRRLLFAKQQLRERSKSLLEANKELAIATKTSAVGAVTTHLLHELKSQLFGLQTVIGRTDGDGTTRETAHQRTGLEATRRMQTLINQMFDVIRNEHGTTRHYEISLNELAEIVTAEVRPLARNADIHFSVLVKTEGTLSSRVANLVIIILINLIQNGIQATPRKKSVILTLVAANNQIECRVLDQGSGFPTRVLPTLFKPGPSTKEGGSGIGLALSKQLASHLGAELELKQNTPEGCEFVLIIPDKLIAGKTVLVS